MFSFSYYNLFIPYLISNFVVSFIAAIAITKKLDLRYGTNIFFVIVAQSLNQYSETLYFGIEDVVL